MNHMSTDLEQSTLSSHYQLRYVPLRHSSLLPNNSHNMSNSSPLFGIFDVGIDQQTVHFRVDVFHCNLETVEATGFGHLDFLSKSLHLDYQRRHAIRTVTFYRSLKILWKFASERTKFSLTMPSLAAKKAKTWEMKYLSSSFRESQCWRSLDRST